jgi:hypothetical protein
VPYQTAVHPPRVVMARTIFIAYPPVDSLGRAQPEVHQSIRKTKPFLLI